MAPWQEKSATKLAKIRATGGRGDGRTWTHRWISRPRDWHEAFVPNVPRLAVGTNEYLHALSLRDHGAVRCGMLRSKGPLSLCALVLLGLSCHLLSHWATSLRALASRARRAGGRRGDSRWELDADAADPPPQPTVSWLTPDEVESDERIHIRTCAECGRVRILPRWVAAPESPQLRQGRFRCKSSPDARFNSCSVPEYLFATSERVHDCETYT